MANVHYLKTCSTLYKDVKSGIKEFEVKNDRDFEIGDTLILEELNIKERCTGAWMPKLITHKFYDSAKKDHVILGTQDIKF